MKDFIYWAVLALYAGFLLKLILPQFRLGREQMRELWALAEAQQACEQIDYSGPPQFWWGSE